MTALTGEALHRFAEYGYLVVPGLVDARDLDRADAELDRLLTDGPPPCGHVGFHFYWQRPAESPALFQLLGRSDGILDTARKLVGCTGVEVAFDQAQVALNIPPYVHRPGRPHIDGYAPGQHTPGTFRLLAGLLLNDQLTDNSGNLWVWPGTHLAHAAFFAEHGSDAFAAAGGYPDIDLPEPTQVHGRRGDVLLAHYLLGHNIGGNYQSERTRRAVYWRLRAPGHADRWAACLSDAWHEYPTFRHALDRGGHQPIQAPR